MVCPRANSPQTTTTHNAVLCHAVGLCLRVGYLSGYPDVAPDVKLEVEKGLNAKQLEEVRAVMAAAIQVGLVIMLAPCLLDASLLRNAPALSRHTLSGQPRSAPGVCACREPSELARRTQ